jgi:hypothetical protein
MELPNTKVRGTKGLLAAPSSRMGSDGSSTLRGRTKAWARELQALRGGLSRPRVPSLLPQRRSPSGLLAPFFAPWQIALVNARLVAEHSRQIDLHGLCAGFTTAQLTIRVGDFTDVLLQARYG